MADSGLHLVNVWTDPEPGPGGFNPMASSMLWLPADYKVGQPTPAFVYVHRWGGYPYDPVPSSLGPLLAAQGCALLSLCLRRRGMEGQLAAVADNDHRDIKLALDYLHTNGFGKAVLVGEELGCISALNYLARHRDARVAGVALLDPVEAPSAWLKSTAGDADYGDALELAVTAARQGAGMDVRIDLLPAAGPAVTQNALAFLSWWGPSADFHLERMLENISAPLLSLTTGVRELPAELTGDSPAGNRSSQSLAADDSESLARALVAFADTAGIASLDAPPLAMVEVESAGQRLFGFHWSPADGRPVKTAILLMHGLTSSPLSPLFLKMAPELAQTGTAVLAVEIRRSGWAGHETALLDYDAEDMDVWMQYLLDQGYEKIVLAGASIGSISVGRYQSVRQHPNVVAIAHLMPTADCPTWFRKGVGDEAYQAAAEQARTAVAAGQGASELIDVDLRQPPPNRYGGRFRWTQRAASWLSWFGPDADSVNSQHIANAKVPLLLLSGTEDSYNDEARFAELRAAAVNAPSIDEIWYPGVDHGLAGVETQVARDLLAWMNKTGALD